MYCKSTFQKNLGTAKTFKKWRNLPKQASTLIPLCKNKHNNPSILFLTRPEHLPYPGQICFPGGKFDKNLDKSIEQTAIRETFEETGIFPEKIEIWGKLPGVPDRKGDMLVTPIVGEIFKNEKVIIDEDNFLKNYKVSKDEVDEIFTVEIESLLDRKNIELVRYERGSKSDDKNITVHQVPLYKINEVEQDIWGLTAIQLNIALHYLYGQKILTKVVT